MRELQKHAHIQYVYMEHTRTSDACNLFTSRNMVRECSAAFEIVRRRGLRVERRRVHLTFVSFVSPPYGLMARERQPRACKLNFLRLLTQMRLVCEAIFVLAGRVVAFSHPIACPPKICIYLYMLRGRLPFGICVTHIKAERWIIYITRTIRWWINILQNVATNWETEEKLDIDAF